MQMKSQREKCINASYYGLLCIPQMHFRKKPFYCSKNRRRVHIPIDGDVRKFVAHVIVQSQKTFKTCNFPKYGVLQAGRRLCKLSFHRIQGNTTEKIGESLNFKLAN